MPKSRSNSVGFVDTDTVEVADEVRGECRAARPPSLTLCVISASRYHGGVLRSFRDKTAEAIWERQHVRKMAPEVQRAALRKLLMLDAAESLDDLRVPPGNRLEKLHGDRAGQHSIRVNDQWRLCFRWTDAGPEDVEIVDYH